MNKVNCFLIAVAVALLSASPLMAQQQRISPHETISARIGSGRGAPLVTITYGRPYSKAPNGGEIRKIWGTLVPWGKAWRMGSDEATLLVIPRPMVIGETTIPAGAYTLYCVPEESGVSKMAFSTNIGKWGIPVDETKDLARVEMKKSTLDKQLDQFTMAIENDPSTPGGGVIKLMWETTQFSVPFKLQP